MAAKFSMLMMSTVLWSMVGNLVWLGVVRSWPGDVEVQMIQSLFDTAQLMFEGAWI